MLASKRVLSAPVKLSNPPPEGADGTGATIFGFVDVRDIVSSFFKQGGCGVGMLIRLEVVAGSGMLGLVVHSHTWARPAARRAAGRRGPGRCDGGRRASRLGRPRGALSRRGAPSVPPPELSGIDLKSMKMLQRMRILEEKGQSFAPIALKDLAVIGA